MKVVPSTDMGKTRKDQCVGGPGVPVVGLDLVDVRCPETFRGRDQKAGWAQFWVLIDISSRGRNWGVVIIWRVHFTQYLFKCQIEKAS